MSDPTVKAFKRFQPIDDVVANSYDHAEVSRAMRRSDRLKGKLADSVPNSVAGLRIHCEMVERYLGCVDEAPDGHAFISPCFHGLITRHMRSISCSWGSIEAGAPGRTAAKRRSG